MKVEEWSGIREFLETSNCRILHLSNWGRCTTNLTSPSCVICEIIEFEVQFLFFLCNAQGVHTSFCGVGKKKEFDMISHSLALQAHIS
jgi:hypothetical protein